MKEEADLFYPKSEMHVKGAAAHLAGMPTHAPGRRRLPPTSRTECLRLSRRNFIPLFPLALNILLHSVPSTHAGTHPVDIRNALKGRLTECILVHFSGIQCIHPLVRAGAHPVDIRNALKGHPLADQLEDLIGPEPEPEAEVRSFACEIVVIFVSLDQQTV